MEINLFQFTMENAQEMMIVYDAAGQILYANRMAVNMLKYEDILDNCQIADIFPMEENVVDKLRRESLEVREYLAYRGNRTCFPVRVKILRYPGSFLEKEEVYLCIATDITMEKFLEKKIEQVEEDARDATKVKNQFVANVTHELRTPVNGILGNVRELMNQQPKAESQKYLQLIERGCSDMNNLINNILDFSKLEAGKFVLDNRKFHFRNMIDYIRGNHSQRMIEKGLDFTITVSDDIPEYVIGDELRIVQILNNLISNGYKFTSVGGVHLEVIKTALSDRRMELFFMISDTGIGIPKEKQDKLFHSFSQVDASVSRRYGGTGLGLNICKQLVDLMGGDIHVESEQDMGTNFAFHIWVEIPEIEENIEDVREEVFGETGVEKEQELIDKLKNITAKDAANNMWKFGQTQNLEEIRKKLSKLMLCVLMENWEKAEMFAEIIRQLLEDAPEEIKKIALRMKMAVQKEDSDRATQYQEQLLRLMEDSDGSNK